MQMPHLHKFALVCLRAKIDFTIELAFNLRLLDIPFRSLNGCFYNWLSRFATHSNDGKCDICSYFERVYTASIVFFYNTRSACPISQPDNAYTFKPTVFLWHRKMKYNFHSYFPFSYNIEKQNLYFYFRSFFFCHFRKRNSNFHFRFSSFVFLRHWKAEFELPFLYFVFL